MEIKRIYYNFDRNFTSETREMVIRGIKISDLTLKEKYREKYADPHINRERYLWLQTFAGCIDNSKITFAEILGEDDLILGIVPEFIAKKPIFRSEKEMDEYIAKRISYYTEESADFIYQKIDTYLLRNDKSGEEHVREALENIFKKNE